MCNKADAPRVSIQMSDAVALSGIDRLLSAAGKAIATLASAVPANRPSPATEVRHADVLPDSDRKLSGALMRVNHVGEICAQALYEGQALGARDPSLKQHFRDAASEEADHLAWTRQRLDELGAHPSLLNPVWYAGAFAFGVIAGRLGDRVSLSFMAETERQVERHLAGHLDRLPAADLKSRAVVEVMKSDEAAHGQSALRLGGVEMPAAVGGAMRLAARVMTSSAHYL
jgi:ubiquinone biosynthesis monooxygenase Coq7